MLSKIMKVARIWTADPLEFNPPFIEPDPGFTDDHRGQTSGELSFLRVTTHVINRHDG